MNISHAKLSRPLAVLCLLALSAVSLAAAPGEKVERVVKIVPPAKPHVVVRREEVLEVRQTGPAADLLREAYAALARADHDYDGHRKKAMKEIEAAGKLLGLNLRGDGKAHERQGTSDGQLREAHDLLVKAAANLTGKAHHHVVAALGSIKIALKIR